MRKDPDSTDFWLHMNPPGGESSFYAVWKSKLEPVYDPREKGYVHTEQASLEGDRFIHLNCNALSLLSQKVRENIKQGIKIHVVDGKCVEIKDYMEKLTEPVKHLYDLEEHEDFEAIRDDSGMIFAEKGTAALHERKAILITREKGKPDVLRVDYVNQKGKIIRHDSDKDVDEAYIDFGCKGEAFVPKYIADLWVSDPEKQSGLSSILVQAYLLGIRFIYPPVKNDIYLHARILPNGLVRVKHYDYFYGFGDELFFSTANNYKSNKELGTRGLEGTIVNAVLSYRWFFNRQNLKVKVVYDHDYELEREYEWQNKEDFVSYMKSVKEYEQNGIIKLEELINNSVNSKWSKRKNNLYFDKKKANLYKHVTIEENA